MEVTPGAEIQDGRIQSFKVNFSKLSLVALYFLFLSLLPYHYSRDKIKMEIATFFSKSSASWWLTNLLIVVLSPLLQACEL